MMGPAKVWACVLKDARIDISYRLSFVLDVVDGLLMFAVYGVLAGLFGNQALDGFPPLGFLLVGVAANGALMTALVCFAQAVRGVQTAGAIKAVLATPTSPLAVVLYSSVYPLVRALLDLVLWLVAAALLGAQFAGLTGHGILAVLVVFFVAALSMAGFGFVAAAFAVVFKRGDPVMWMIGGGSMLLGGVLYPTSSLPPMLAILSQWVPTTHALHAMREILLGGGGLVEVAPSLGVLAWFGVIGVPLGLMTLAAAIQYARREGTLGHV
jgi:ABC-2 type transport system permease protein